MNHDVSVDQACHHCVGELRTGFVVSVVMMKYQHRRWSNDPVDENNDFSDQAMLDHHLPATSKQASYCSLNDL